MFETALPVQLRSKQEDLQPQELEVIEGIKRKGNEEVEKIENFETQENNSENIEDVFVKYQEKLVQEVEEIMKNTRSSYDAVSKTNADLQTFTNSIDEDKKKTVQEKIQFLQKYAKQALLVLSESALKLLMMPVSGDVSNRDVYSNITNDVSSEDVMAAYEESLLVNRDFEAEEKLLNGNLVSKQLIHEKSLNSVYTIKFDNGTRGIFKPMSGERSVFSGLPGLPASSLDSKPGTYYKREKAAYLVDSFLDFNLVPPTVIREIDGEVGSLQEFVDYKQSGSDLSDEQLAELSNGLKEQLLALFVEDHVIRSFDRPFLHNTLISEDDNGVEKLYAIDNGLSFSLDPPRVYRAFFDNELPDEVIEKLASFMENVPKQEKLRAELSELLSQKEIDAFFSRLWRITTIILKSGTISESKGGRVRKFS